MNCTHWRATGSPPIPMARDAGVVAASLQEAVLDVEFVQENGPEKVEDKQTIFAQLDRLAPPNALLVSRPRPSWPRASPKPCRAGRAA